MNDITSEASIKQLVDHFYSLVREDEILGTVFRNVIQGDWQPHLDKMYDFWNAALFGVPGFKGNPLAKHAPLAIGPEHFTRWLQLFGQTIDEHFEGSVADEAKKRAGSMAELFQQRLHVTRGKSKIIF